MDSSTGNLSRSLGEPCISDVLADDSYVCADGNISVVGPNGTRLWRFSKPGWGVQQGDGPSTGPYLAFLAPDAQSVAASGPVSPFSELITSQGNEVELPQTVLVLGWIGIRWLIGWTGAGEEMTLIDTSNPSHVVDLGFQGSFAGSFP